MLYSLAAHCGSVGMCGVCFLKPLELGTGNPDKIAKNRLSDNFTQSFLLLLVLLECRYVPGKNGKRGGSWGHEGHPIQIFMRINVVCKHTLLHCYRHSHFFFVVLSPLPRIDSNSTKKRIVRRSQQKESVLISDIRTWNRKYFFFVALVILSSDNNHNLACTRRHRISRITSSSTPVPPILAVSVSFRSHHSMDPRISEMWWIYSSHPFNFISSIKRKTENPKTTWLFAITNETFSVAECHCYCLVMLLFCLYIRLYYFFS